MSRSKAALGLIIVAFAVVVFWSCSWQGRGILVLVGTGAAAVVAIQRRNPILEYLYFCRFPIIMGLVLVLGPFLAVFAAPLILKNLFVLDFGELVVVTALTFLLSTIVVFTFGLIAGLAHVRFQVRELKAPSWFGARPLRIGSWVFLLLLSMPMVGVTVALSTERSPWMRLLAVWLGSIVTAFFASGVLLLRGYLVRGGSGMDLPFQPKWKAFESVRKMKAPDFAQQIGQRAAGYLARVPGCQTGYLEPDGRLSPGHGAATILALATVLVYGLGFQFLRPDQPWVEIPAIAYVLMLLIFAALFLPAASFFLDRFRVPVVLLILFCSFLSYNVSNLDHYYELSPEVADFNPGKDDPQQILRSWRSRFEAGEEPVLVAVAASGGGITASLWTAQVLAGLEQDMPGFARSVHVISAVSGGGVGSMYFADAYTEHGPPAGEDLERIIEAAGRSSLAATTWGIVYPDLWRGLSLPFLGEGLHDRGWAMEQMWRRHLRNREATLSSWRKDVLQGRRPAVLFNATICETGSPFVLSPVHTPGDGVRRFGELYGKRDLPVVTAARLSATFPWVSPITRARTDKDGYHLADGGYYDNFGVLRVVDWLSDEDFLKEYWRLGGRKILFIQIRASDPEQEKTTPKEGAGWLYATLGPIETMFKVRTPLQEFRNRSLLNSVKHRWTSRGGQWGEAVFSLSTQAPLSWHLSEDQHNAIRGYWNSERSRSQVLKIRSFLPPRSEPAITLAAGG